MKLLSRGLRKVKWKSFRNRAALSKIFDVKSVSLERCAARFQASRKTHHCAFAMSQSETEEGVRYLMENERN